MKTRKLVCGVGVNDSDYVVVEWETTVINGKQKQGESVDLSFLPSLDEYD